MIKECIKCGTKFTKEELQIAKEQGSPILFCKMKCKENFYKDLFAGQSQTKIWEEEHRTNREYGKEKTMKAFKEWQKTHPKGFFYDWLKSLGDFKQHKMDKNL